EKAGVRLKGDVPILLSEDSADVWSGREFFDLGNRAGAPPDMFCHAGQNWRFPSYRWDALERDGYAWWRARLRRASKFYHAYRIDHVLGFFRIWEVPERECTGMLGRFVPALPLRRADLLAAGVSSATIDRLVDPVFSDEDVSGLLGARKDEASPWLRRVEGGWKIDRDVFVSEQALFRAGLPKELEDGLLKLYGDRVLLRFAGDAGDFHPYWYWYDARAFRSLDGATADKVSAQIHAYFDRQQDFWEANGRKLLTMMVEETDMLVCAEDLGVVPDCVPKTLADMGILGLKIERWMRDWSAPGQPWIPVDRYPRLTVCSSGTHDTATLRGYWEEEGWPREQYAAELGLSPCPAYLTEEAAEAIVRRNLDSNSVLAILPLQDWLALSYGQRPLSPQDERINVPGSLDASNWTWRMPRPVSALEEDKALTARIAGLCRERSARPF
ncbi:MAG: 4-alpha-glucanotransferase, partial [Fibrobacterales bacterium]|nr:4-alpha-glucanotransferase [Fibrobacterales bacterium]